MDRHDILATLDPPVTDVEIDLMEERMRLYLFPNEVKTEEEEAAFRLAVGYQIAHERSQAQAFGQIPQGVSSFRIGDFQMVFENGASREALTRKTICEAAYSVLLRAGLLCRGLPRTVSA